MPSPFTLKENAIDRLHLIESNQITYIVNETLGANAFKVLRTVDVSKIDIGRLQVFVYGHASGGGATTIPNMGNMLFISSNSLIAAYKIVNNTVSIGFVCSGAGFAPTAPYFTLYMGYYVMYY